MKPLLLISLIRCLSVGVITAWAAALALSADDTPVHTASPSPSTNTPPVDATLSTPKTTLAEPGSNATNRPVASVPAVADGSKTNAVATVDPSSYEYFKLINDRNIFSASRTRSSPREENRESRPRRPRIDRFALVGTMSYFKGTFAFFDGSESSYRKSVKVGEMVAGFKVDAIQSDGASLSHGTNVYSLKVGSGMQREEEGEWKAAASPGSFEVASSRSDKTEKPEKTDAAPAETKGGESDILKRLLEKREKELKNEK